VRISNRRSSGTLFWMLAITIPIVVVLSTHLWLRTGYTADVFHLQGFLAQYNEGIYRYRIVGRESVLWTYRFLTSHFSDKPFPMPRDPAATLLFYASYVVVIGTGFFCSNLLLLLLLADRDKHLPDLNLAIYFFLTLLQALAMAVVTPYDQVSYAIILLGFWAVSKCEGPAAYLLLGVTAVAGGLNRETEFLVTPALLAVALFTKGKTRERYRNAGIYHLGIFALVYVGVRILLPTSHPVSGGLTWGGVWALESLVVLALITFIGTLMAVRLYANVFPTIALLVLSAPYLATIALSGVLRELRLLLPLLLGQAFVYVEISRSRGHSGRVRVRSQTSVEDEADGELVG
jgi:hypothetical protein